MPFWPSCPRFCGAASMSGGEKSYEEARVGRVFNARRPDRFPIAVLFAKSDADVIAGVRLARKIGVTVSVRSGGHSWAAWSVRENALLIDLGGMCEMGGPISKTRS